MIRLQQADFDIAAEIDALVRGRTDIGAVVSFTGLVRGEVGGQPIVAMTLEHYPAMAERELTEIERQARARWSLDDCLILHRFGELMPGDRIVLVVTASAHRADAFAAAEFLMDFLKTRAPFWKQERTLGGGQWVDAAASDDVAAERWKT